MTDEQILAIAIPLGVVVAFPAMGYAFAAIGGWRVLARHYASAEPFHGRRFWLRSARIGPVGYGACLMPGANRDGIYLSVMLPFRFAHPPLQIPWRDISCSKSHSLFLPRAELRFAEAPEVSVTISQRLADMLLAERSL